MNRAVQAMAIGEHALQCRIWCEFVESGDNWADAASRNGLACATTALWGFRMEQCSIPARVWQPRGPLQLLCELQAYWAITSAV